MFVELKLFASQRKKQSRDTEMTCVINDGNNFLLHPNTKLMFAHHVSQLSAIRVKLPTTPVMLYSYRRAWKSSDGQEKNTVRRWKYMLYIWVENSWQTPVACEHVPQPRLSIHSTAWCLCEGVFLFFVFSYLHVTCFLILNYSSRCAKAWLWLQKSFINSPTSTTIKY